MSPCPFPTTITITPQAPPIIIAIMIIIIQSDHLISARLLDLVIANNKKENMPNMDFAVSADHRVKLKESKKKDMYQNLA